MSTFLQQFAERFAALDRDHLEHLTSLYSTDVCFIDPLHQINGLNALQRYFSELYANVEDLSFQFHGHDAVAEGSGYLRWTMTYRHPRLRGGAPVSVTGCSHLRWADKVYYHRDYFDAGALLYEHLPLLGSVIRGLKRRLA